MDTIYISREAPRVPLMSEDELRRAAEEGLLGESHYLDLKREVKSGPRENRELARDLASFAVDGGTLVVGVAEREGSTPELVPQPLDGLPERIEQVASMVPDPPLAVIGRAIPSRDDPTLGYLLVHVPASPAAPHMVDGRYLGRGDKTKRYLSDAEVLRLHERRRLDTADALGLLDAEFARDPVPAESRRQAHLFLLAEPLTGRPEMLLQLTEGSGWQQRLMAFAHKYGANGELEATLRLSGIGGFSPDLSAMQSMDLRPGGAALTTYGLAEGRMLRLDARDPESVAELEVHEDGGLRLFTSRLSDHLGGRTAEPDGDSQVLFEAAVVIYARRFIAFARGVAEEAGYFGNWSLALGATGLRGCYSYRLQQRSIGSGGARYSEDVYRRAAVATYAELTARPGEVADRLAGQLLRAFGSRQLFAAALSDA